VELESTGLAQHALIVKLEPIKALQHTLARYVHLALLGPTRLRVNHLVQQLPVLQAKRLLLALPQQT